MRKRIAILYGSETGQAEAISAQIYDQCRHSLDVLFDNFDVSVDRFCLSDTEKRFSLERERTVVFVVSTTGEGEPPQNALKFYRRFRKRTLDSNLLSHLSYTLLALGDSNYERFAHFGRDLDKRLQELSAKRFYELGFGDDAVGLEVGVEPWIEGLFPAILNHFKAYTTLKVPTIEVKLLSTTDWNMSVKDNCPLMAANPVLAQLNELTLPLISSKFESFKIKIHESLPEEFSEDNEFYFKTLPVMDSKIFDSTVVGINQLTPTNGADNELNPSTDNKTILEATVEVETKGDECLKYSTGDSFGFIVGNCDEEVKQLLICLDMWPKRDFYCEVLTPEVFPHLPKVSKVFDLLKYYLEIRSVPKKASLRHLADFCANPYHKRRLLELSSREGSDDYQTFIRNDSVVLLDILQMFDSCRPPLEVLLANCPLFTPRYYSVINPPTLENRNRFRITFSVICFEEKNMRKDTQLMGVFTGTLFRRYLEHKNASNEDKSDVANRLAKLSLESNIKSLKVFKRKNPYFKLPANPNTPLILICAGTGVAPFIGFLEERRLMASRSPIPLGETWLFYGCRHSKLDFIYEKELKEFSNSQTLTQLLVCFSRESETESEVDSAPKYVQQLIEKSSKAVYRLIDSKKGFVYVCGDAKGMSVSVFNAVVKVVEDLGQQNHENAVKYVRDLQSDKRYLQDIWT